MNSAQTDDRDVEGQTQTVLRCQKRTARCNNRVLGSGPPISVEVGERKCAPHAVAAGVLQLALNDLIDAIALI
jgi:hypothetical protein